MTRKQENIVFVISSIIIWSLMMLILITIPSSLSELQTMLLSFGPLVITALSYTCGKMAMKRELEDEPKRI